MAIRKSSSSGIPFGNTAGRPAAQIGQPYFNGEEKRLELYTSTGWQNIVSETPGVVSVSGSYLESVGSATLEITGTNFTSGAIASVIGTNGVEINANSTTVNSIVSVSAVFSGLVAANEPYDIKVTNTSNLFGLLPDAVYVNNILSWQTASGSLGTFGDNVSISVSATATDDSTITYALANGSSLPSGVTLNSATGLISGTLPDIASDTTYTFTINASDGANPVVPRTFSIASNAAPTWVTAAGSLGEFAEQSSISVTLLATDGQTVTYSLASGSSLPTGITLNSSSGVVSGTLPDISVNTTYTFTINASDGINTVPRTFSILSRVVFPIEYLIVGGGGAGGDYFQGGGYNAAGAGGGAGGYLYSGSATSFLNAASIIVGAAGVSTATSNTSGGFASNGGNSTFEALTAIGGGRGGAGNCSVSGNAYTASSGGSGGGGVRPDGGGAFANAGTNTAGQGNAGGYYVSGDGDGGGGGGATAAGTSGGQGSQGGAGYTSSITGTSVVYAAGGGGGKGSSSQGGYSWSGSGGSGVGGNGGPKQANSTGSNASSTSYGSGGGGAGSGANDTSVFSKGGNGAGGVVIIAYPNTFPAATISAGLTYDLPTRSGYRVYRFTAGTGTITI